MAKIEGGCLCGAVRYRAEGEPLMQVVCHCRTCRRNTGSTFSVNLAVPEDSLTVDGEVATYEDMTGASGQPMYRRFCARCGSPLWGGGPAYGPLAFIKAGTLDDDTWVAPETHIWTCEKHPWTEIPPGAKILDRNPA